MGYDPFLRYHQNRRYHVSARGLHGLDFKCPVPRTIQSVPRLVVNVSEFLVDVSELVNIAQVHERVRLPACLLACLLARLPACPRNWP